MRSALVLLTVLSVGRLAADPLECITDGTAEQIKENLPNGSILYRDCYHCKEPAFEKIRITGTVLQPCHMRGLEAERALFIDGVVLERFQMPVCGTPEKIVPSGTVLSNELVVLNYAYILDEKSGEARNIADAFGEGSHHQCKNFQVRKRAPRTTEKKKPAGK